MRHWQDTPFKQWLHDLVWEWHRDEDVQSLSYWRLRPRVAFIAWFVLAVVAWAVLIVAGVGFIHILRGS